MLREWDRKDFCAAAELFLIPGVHQGMKQTLRLGVPVFVALILGLSASGQEPAPYPATSPAYGPVVLDWAPPAMAQLSALAAVKNSFTLDRNMLGVAANAW